MNTHFFCVRFWHYPIHYAEFTVNEERAYSGYEQSYDANNFFFQLYFKRATNHYVIFGLLPNILFTYLSFGQFALDPREGERLSFSITIVLITVTHSIVTSSLLPVCNEWIWLNSFNFLSMNFTLIGIVETLFVIWLISLAKKRAKKSEKAVDDNEEDELLSLVSNDQSTNMNNNEENGLLSLVLDEHADSNDTKGNLHLCALDHCDHQINVEQSDDERWNGPKRLVDLFYKKKPKGVSDLAYIVDSLSIIMIPLIYTFFIVIMIQTNIRWEDDIN